MRRRCGIVGVCLACVTFAAFLPSLNNGFVNRDDPAYVLDNLDIRGCTPHHAAKLFSSTYVSQYVPATMLTYMAEYGLFRLNPAAYHCTSLIIHIVNCLLVFALFYGLSGSCFAGGVTALLFAVHPLRVEAVAWTAERKEVLAALFYLLSLLFYLSYRKKSGKKFYFLCLFSLLISLLSKAMAISQPFLLLCIDYLMNRKIDRKNLLEKAPFFALSAMFAVAAVATAGQFINYYPHYSIVQRALMPAWAIVFYLVKTVVPLNLSASYYLPDVPEKGATAAMALCAVALAAIVAFVYYSRRFSKKAVFGSLFFIITIMPVLQIVNSGGLVLVADRYTYVPMLGIYFIIAAGLSGLTGKKIAKNAVYGGLVAVAAVLSYLTWQRCGVWNDSLTLWNDIIEKSPAAAQAYDGRAGAYRDNGDYNRAIADFNKAMELDPGFAAAYFGRGYIYCAFLGKIDPAIADLKKAVALAPDFPDAWNTLGIAYGMEDSCGPATMGFDRAIALKPDFADAYVNRGLAYMNCSGNPGRAIADFTKAITLDPGLAKAHLLRGILLRMKGSFDEAIGDLNKAIQLDPRDSALAARNRGLASARQAR
jgi:tetratricopeptide (TPR) repeat protein